MASTIRVQRICQHCGKTFTAKTSVTQYCGDTCAKRAYKVKLRQAKIQKSNSETQAARSKSVEELKAKEFLGIDEACTLLGLSRATVFRLLQSGKIQATKLGRRTIIYSAPQSQDQNTVNLRW